MWDVFTADCGGGTTNGASAGATAGSGGTAQGTPAAACAAAIFLPSRVALTTTEVMAFRLVPVVCLLRFPVGIPVPVRPPDVTEAGPPRPSIEISPSSPFCLALESFWKYF